MNNYVQMYNYSIKLDYINRSNDESDTQYRKEILAVFDLKEYSNEIIEKQDLLFSKVEKEYDEILEYLKNNDRLALIRNITKKDCFIILFSWEYFYHNHLLLQAILGNASDNKIKLMKDKLFLKISKSEYTEK